MKLVPISMIPTESIEPDPLNPNSMDPKQQKALNDTIDKFGYAHEIWVRKVDQKYRIIDGEHRWNYLKEHGIKDAPVRVFKVNEEDAILLRQISFNLRGHQSLPKSAEELKILFEAKRFDDFVKYTAASKHSNENILENRFHIVDKPECELVTKAKEKKTLHKIKKSKIYKLGDHRLMCGDATMHCKELLNGEKVSLLLTDPPYGVNMTNNLEHRIRARARSPTAHDGLLNDTKKEITDYTAFLHSVISPIQWAEKASLYVFSGGQMLEQFLKAIRQTIPVSQILVWDKERPTFNTYDYKTYTEFIIYAKFPKRVWNGDKKQPNIIRAPREARSDWHPTQKPLPMLSYFMRMSTMEGDIVYDPFGGGGSTLLAAEQTNRKARLIELDPQYVSATIARWEEFTGEKHEICEI